MTFDFLGFGTSDKPADAAYSFKHQLGDLEAVVERLGLGKIVPVAHDSSGPASINYALAHPKGVDSVIMLNSAYAEDSTVLWPEMITLFATESLHEGSVKNLGRYAANWIAWWPRRPSSTAALT